MLQIFSYLDYKEYLKQLIIESPSPRFRSSLIESMGCQKSFFSQVLNSEVHLTPDHAANLVEKLRWDDLTSEYFMTLVLFARAGSPLLKKRLKKQLDMIRNKSTQPSETLKWPTLQDIETQSVYYSSWFFAAIHIITSIPKYNTAEKISLRLELPLTRVLETLQWLTKIQLIEKTNLGYQIKNQGLHLKNTSHLLEMHHSHWRHKALENLQKGDSDAIHYSAVFAISQDDYYKLKEITMDYIRNCTSTIAPSKSEELFALALDVFKVY